MPVRHTLFSILLATSILGCVTVRTPTEAVVDVLAEPRVRDEATRLRVTVRGGSDLAALEVSHDEELRPPRFPLRVTLVPRDGDASRVFEVSAVAYGREETVIGRRVVRGNFQAGRTLAIQLLLEDCCYDVAPTCGRGQTCDDCRCHDPSVITPETDAGPLLDAFTPADAVSAIDAGTHADEDASTAEPDASTTEPDDASTPPDAFEPRGVCAGMPVGTICRAAAGACDVAETCDGVSPDCPTDTLAPPSVTCRASVGACDPAEHCTGSSPSCPADRHASAGTSCGLGLTCNTDGFCVGSCWIVGSLCHISDNSECGMGRCQSDGSCANTPDQICHCNGTCMDGGCAIDCGERSECCALIDPPICVGRGACTGGP